MNEVDCETLWNVIDSATVTITGRDIVTALHSCHFGQYTVAPCPSAITFDEIDNGMCGGHFGHRKSHTPFAFYWRICCLLTQYWKQTCVYVFHSEYEVSILDFIYGEMFKFYTTSKACQNPLILVRALPFPMLVTSLVCKYYPIPISDVEVKDFNYFDKQHWESSLHGLQLWARLSPPPPHAPSITPTRSLVPTSIIAK